MSGSPHVSGQVVNAADLNDRVKCYDRSTSTVDVVSSAALTNLYSQSLGAGFLSTDRMIRITVMGDYLNNSGSSQTLKIHIYGTTDLWGDTTTATITASAVRREFLLQLLVANLGATNSQKISGTWTLSAATAGSVAGIGDIDGGMQHITAFGGTSAWDTTVLQTFNIAAQHGASNANLSIRKKYAMWELL